MAYISDTFVALCSRLGKRLDDEFVSRCELVSKSGLEFYKTDLCGTGNSSRDNIEGVKVDNRVDMAELLRTSPLYVC